MISKPIVYIFIDRGISRDIVIVLDASNRGGWAALIAFVKQLIGAFDVSIKGTHFALVAYAGRSTVVFSFPASNKPDALYNVNVVQGLVNKARLLGNGRNIFQALGDVSTLFTLPMLYSRKTARKVQFYNLISHDWFVIVYLFRTFCLLSFFLIG